MPEIESNSTNLAILKALADESRLKIIAILLKKDTYAEYLADSLGVSAPTINYHMEKLEKAGLVSSEKLGQYVIYSVNREIMDKPVGELIESIISYDDKMSYEDKVIKNFFEYGRLIKIPSQLKKREIVIGYIADKFELGKTYSEKEFLSVIIDMHDDYCTIRRDLIGMGFIEDLNRKYKRIK